MDYSYCFGISLTKVHTEKEQGSAQSNRDSTGTEEIFFFIYYQSNLFVYLFITNKWGSPLTLK